MSINRGYGSEAGAGIMCVDIVQGCKNESTHVSVPCLCSMTRSYWCDDDGIML